MKGKIIKISGPLIIAEGMADAKMFDLAFVGTNKLIGEIIELKKDKASIQVYEDTSLISPGEEVISSNMPLSTELGPGLMGGIFDGIGRPLKDMYAKYGDYIDKGTKVDALDRQKTWAFAPIKKVGDSVLAGDILGIVQENEVVEHRIMVPNGAKGKITAIQSGSFSVEQTIAIIKDDNGKDINITMLSHWPVRRGRPYSKKLAPSTPLITGQRVIDTLFPIAKGGVAAVPGPFGSGKTVVQHQIAKWADADIVVYIGCGERGNEITDVLNEFSHLIDPKTGHSLMKRTVLIANTSDMPVAAREASIYTGITIAEYFRDMGYNVAVMADSTSRWAEALREMGARLEEMPGDEGYPAYLSSRLSEFYERAGIVNLNGTDKTRQGSITAIGAVSPPGGDMSEPVVQATMRIIKVFWGLSASLAYKRHFPAIDWNQSYSLYSDRLKNWYDKNIDPSFNALKDQAAQLLHEESKLLEIVRFVGMDALSPRDRLTLEAAKSIREDFLHQNAFFDADSFTSLDCQANILKLIITFYKLGQEALDNGMNIDDLLSIEARNSIARSKIFKEQAQFDEAMAKLKQQLQKEA